VVDDDDHSGPNGRCVLAGVFAMGQSVFVGEAPVPDRGVACSSAPTADIHGLRAQLELRRRSVNRRDGVAVAAAIAIFVVGGFDLVFRLGVPDWSTDEVTYKTAGWAAFHGGGMLADYETPPLAKHIIGVFEILLGRSEVPVRISAVVAAILTGLFLALIARRVAGGWAALATAAVWFALPHPGTFKLERFALLDVFMAMFTTLGVLFAIVWGGSQKWRWVVAAGAALGLATACKQPGALALVPIGIFVLAGGAFSVRSFLQLSALAATAAGAFVAAYIPVINQMPAQVRYMMEFQIRQRARGHAVLVGSHIYAHPPWWATLRWQWDASWVLALCYAFAIIIAVVVAAHRDFNVALLLGVLAINIGFFAFVSRNALPHYPYAWAPVLAVITGLAVSDLARRGGWARIGAVVIALALVAPAVQLAERTAQMQPTDYAATAQLLRTTLGTHPRVDIVGYANVLRAYLPQSLLVPDSTIRSVNAVVLDSSVTDRLGYAWRSRYLDAHPDAFSAHKVGHLLVYLPRT
jgi:4-amino-4-deoxy-L-arabinose transferase-like glycosyltransferase